MNTSSDAVDICSVDIKQSDFCVQFTDEAIRYASHVNIYKGDRIVFHIKYLRLRGGFVLNDVADGEWQTERFVECRNLTAGGVRVSVCLRDGVPHLELPGASPIELGNRFSLIGKLTAHLPRSIRLVTQRTSQARTTTQLVQMRSLEDSGIALGLDAVVTANGAFFIEGWIDDRNVRLSGVSLIDFATGQREYLPVYRVRRPDVEAHLQTSRPHEFGFWTVGASGGMLLEGSALTLVFVDGSGVPLTVGLPVRQTQHEFFDFLLANFGRRNIIGNRTARSFADLNAGYGEILSSLYKDTCGSRNSLSSTQFGRPHKPRVSFICVLYGIPDFLYLLVSQFARFSNLNEIEFIFVNNSPEIEEIVVRDAELASLVFSASIRVLTLNQNSGFSYANNIGVQAALADLIVIINPDVFPREAGSIKRLFTLAENGCGKDIYGGKLFYADGSVMHEGMFFSKDHKLTALCTSPIWTVEHYRKGFSDTSSAAIRPVPALTGALMVLSKTLYEQMGGFNTEIIFGHYEDADLCLRVQEHGGRALLDPALAYWHYEGMGSVKRPEHIGSNMYNRWYFSNCWGNRIEEVTND